MIAGKRKLCYTDVADFTNIQGVGNDPIYLRYNSVFSVIKQHIKEEYHSFLAEPEYFEDEDRIFWYTEQWSDNESPIRLCDLDSEARELFKAKLDVITSHFAEVTVSLTGEGKRILESAIKYVDEQFVYCVGDRLVLAVWGMTPDIYRHNTNGMIIHELDFTEYSFVNFNPGRHGSLKIKLESRVRRKKGSKLTCRDLPEVIAKEGYEFVAWEPEPVGVEVKDDLSFTAVYKKSLPEGNMCNVKFVADGNCSIDGADTVQVERNSVLRDEQIPGLIFKDGYSFAGWNGDIASPITEDTVFKVISRENDRMCHVRFLPVEGCELSGTLEFDVPCGRALSIEQIPNVVCAPDYHFSGWSTDIASPITCDVTIYPLCEKESTDITVSFDSGDNGSIEGTAMFTMPLGSMLDISQIPLVKPKPGYHFIGWDRTPMDMVLNEDITFHAVYEEKQPWWKRFWLWLLSIGGCLLRLLLFLLLLLLFLWLLSMLRSCDGDDVLDGNDIRNGPALVEPGDSIHDGFRDNPGFAEDGVIGDTPSTPIDDADLGESVDPGNGDNDYHVGVLPVDPGVPPVDNPENPEGPQIIPNIINVFFTDDNANLNAFAKDFRDIYPDTELYKLDYDDLVKRVSIMMPAEERVQMKEEITRRLGEKYSFFIVDEITYAQSSLNGAGGGYAGQNAGWHLLAVNAPQAWTITIGTSEVVVAVVDDGFDDTHQFLKDKIVKPYNVFTKNGQLDNASGHGTHTAGLAVGMVREDGKAAGIAPGCSLMPIQVFDGNMCRTSSQVSGIAYAIHNGADVVNMSVGCDFSAFRNYAPEEQLEIAKQKFKEEELMWRRVYRMALEKNTVLVFSTGNDNVVSYLNPQNRPDSIISVTAVNPQLQKSIFGGGSGSNFGIGSTIAAPGSEIFSTVPVNDFGYMQGTSMAAPIVAGVVALMKSIDKNITIGETIDILQKSGRPLSDPSLGPLVQADRALMLLKNGNLPSDDERPRGGNETAPRDYSDIFRKISEHQRAIGELVRQLPPEEQKKFR